MKLLFKNQVVVCGIIVCALSYLPISAQSLGNTIGIKKAGVDINKFKPIASKFSKTITIATKKMTAAEQKTVALLSKAVAKTANNIRELSVPIREVIKKIAAAAKVANLKKNTAKFKLAEVRKVAATSTKASALR